MDKKVKLTASLLLLAVFLLFSLVGNGSKIQIWEEKEVVQPLDSKKNVNETLEDGQGETRSDQIFVDVRGCVQRPGVYQVPVESRVFEVIDLAGGFTDDAELKSVNRAAVLLDEQVIHVLSKEEFEQQQRLHPGYVDGLVELNSADSTALESLSGIGPSMAERIIQYRDENGPFQRIEDLMKVSGIGEKTFQKLKGDICVR